MLVFVTLTTLLSTADARAQAVTFAGVERQLGGGFKNADAVAVDASGNVYVADLGNAAVKELPAGCTSASCVNTLPGSFSSPSGIATDAAGDIYVADSNNGTVTVIPAGCTQANCQKVIGSFDNPIGVAADSAGNIYVDSNHDGTLLEIPVGCISSTCAVELEGGLGSPGAIALEPGNTIFVADDSTGKISVVPLGCTNASCVSQILGFQSSTGLTATADGSLYVSDSNAGTLYKLAAGCANASCATTLLTSVVAFGNAVDAAGNIYFATHDQSGTVKELLPGAYNFGPFDVGSTSPTAALVFYFTASGQIEAPLVLTGGTPGLDFVDAGTGSCATNGTAYAYNTGDTCTVDVTFKSSTPGLRRGAVQLLGSGGAVLANANIYGAGIGSLLAASSGVAVTIPGTYASPYGIAVDDAGNLYVSSRDNLTVSEIPRGCTSTTCVSQIGGGFTGPVSIVIDGAGTAYVSDSNQIKTIPRGCTSASCVTSLGALTSTARNLAVDPSGTLYWSSLTQVFKAPSGCTSASCVVTLPGGFANIGALADDAAGNLYVADSNNQSISEVPAGCASSSCVLLFNGTFPNVYGATVDGAGNLYIVKGSVVQMFAPGCRDAACAAFVVGLPNNSNSLAVDFAGNIYTANTVTSAAYELPRTTFSPLSASALNGQTSSPQSVVLQNIGTAPLTFPVPTTPGVSNPSLPDNFVLDSTNTCLQTTAGASAPFALAPAASCTLAIDFVAPVNQAGIYSGSVLLTDDSGEAPGTGTATQSISLMGKSIVPIQQIGFGTAPPATLQIGGNAGSVTVNLENSSGIVAATYNNYPITLVVTGPNSYSQTYTARTVAGVATFDLSAAALTTAGSYTYKATLGSFTATAKETVGTPVPASISASGGQAQSAAIGSGFGQPLKVLVVDTNGNPVPGVTVVFTAPGSGASATLSSSAVTGSDGQTSVTATANGIAGSYSVTATVNGSTIAPATFSLQNLQQATTVTVTQTANALVYGQPVTLAATISPATAGGSTPTGTVNFADGGTPLSAAAVTNGSASLSVAVPSVGNHVFGAQYMGDSNFQQSPYASAATPLQVSRASSTMQAPASLSTNYGAAANLQVTVAGQYSGPGIAAPSGAIAYSITNSSSTSVAGGTLSIAGGAATVPVANTLAPGNYIVTLNYAGDANYAAATPIAVSLQVSQIQPTINWAATSALTYGATLASVLNAQAYNGASIVAGTYTYLNGSTAVTSSTVLPAGSYTLTVNFAPADTTTYKTATGTALLTVNKATPAISLAPGASSLLVSNPLTLTATASSTLRTPTGTVTFLDGTASLGTIALTGGVATLTTSSLAVGSHSITAVYSGDSNFTSQTSAASTVQVNDFNLTISASSSSAGDSSTSQTVLPGGTATYTFTISPTGATTFRAAVNLTVSGLPAGATYAITPTSIASGAGATQVTLSVNLPKQTAMLHSGEKLAPLSLALLLLPFVGRLRRSSRRLMRLAAVLLLVLAGAGAAATLTGCGSTTGFFASPQTTYNVTITGTSGALSHATTVTLTVQ